MQIAKRERTFAKFAALAVAEDKAKQQEQAAAQEEEVEEEEEQQKWTHLSLMQNS